MYAFLNTFTLTRQSGSVEQYSNVGFGLLGQILSLQNGSDYETMIRDWVLGPLGMSRTMVRVGQAYKPDLVAGYNGDQRQVESWAGQQQNIFQGTGSLVSCLEDQLIFLQANLGLQPTPLAAALELTHIQTFAQKGLYSTGIGLGWTIFESKGHRVLWKNGGNGSYNSFMGFDQKAQTGVVIMVNSSLNPEAFPTHAGFQILEALRKLP